LFSNDVLSPRRALQYIGLALRHRWARIDA